MHQKNSKKTAEKISVKCSNLCGRTTFIWSFKDNLPFVRSGRLQFIYCKEDEIKEFCASCPQRQRQCCSLLKPFCHLWMVFPVSDAFVHLGTVITLAWLNICLWYPFKKTLVTLSCAVRGGGADCGGNFFFFRFSSARHWVTATKEGWAWCCNKATNLFWHAPQVHHSRGVA